MTSKRGDGSVEWRGTPTDGYWRARVMVAPKKRRWVRLPPGIRHDDEAKARAKARDMQRLANLQKAAQRAAADAAPATPTPGAPLGGMSAAVAPAAAGAALPATAAPPAKGPGRGKRATWDRTGEVGPDLVNGRPHPDELFWFWARRWFGHRKERGLATASDRYRFGKWILPRLGALKTTEITTDDLEQWVAWIDEQVRAGALGWKTASNAWGIVTKAMTDACRSKIHALKARTTNPSTDVEGPDQGIDKAKVYLYPSEFLRLVECEALPLACRRAWAMTVYLWQRAGEAEALHWEDVDLEHGVVHVHRALRAETGLITETKGKKARRFEIEPELMPLLRAMRAERPRDRLVFEPWPLHKDRSRQLRAALRTAGVARADLFASDATRKHITFHDLRATGTTWAAARGDAPLAIMDRAGHEDFETTQIYVREVRNLSRVFGTVFPPLPQALLGRGAPVEPAPLGTTSTPTPTAAASRSSSTDASTKATKRGAAPTAATSGARERVTSRRPGEVRAPMSPEVSPPMSPAFVASQLSRGNASVGAVRGKGFEYSRATPSDAERGDSAASASGAGADLGGSRPVSVGAREAAGTSGTRVDGPAAPSDNTTLRALAAQLLAEGELDAAHAILEALRRGRAPAAASTAAPDVAGPEGEGKTAAS